MLFKHSFHTVVNSGIRYTGFINCDFDKIYIIFALYINKIIFNTESWL